MPISTATISTASPARHLAWLTSDLDQQAVVELGVDGRAEITLGQGTCVLAPSGDGLGAIAAAADRDGPGRRPGRPHPAAGIRPRGGAAGQLDAAVLRRLDAAHRSRRRRLPAPALHAGRRRAPRARRRDQGGDRRRLDHAGLIGRGRVPDHAHPDGRRALRGRGGSVHRLLVDLHRPRPGGRRPPARLRHQRGVDRHRPPLLAAGGRGRPDRPGHRPGQRDAAGAARPTRRSTSPSSTPTRPATPRTTRSCSAGCGPAASSRWTTRCSAAASSTRPTRRNTTRRCAA